ncbi:MAG: transcriptional regulator [Actinobacteria bacterium]|nr:MAG: transcriptional regulator [Actinomycetota bacterium]
MLPKVKENCTKRLNRIAGQVTGIQKMVEKETYCIDILVQIAAVRAALDKVGLCVLKGHVEDCVVKASKEGQLEQYLDELEDALSKFLK